MLTQALVHIKVADVGFGSAHTVTLRLLRWARYARVGLACLGALFIRLSLTCLPRVGGTIEPR